ncbi:hypothetical protein [Tamaricihabitans halophyticus]|uniref:aa3-type cytochrome oxidase subunit CtaJ n=1 Tax=Tamaricihabitans halophyticus TaxID=1262583 RepID=UPI00104AF59E|nr:hypothetical protein [Tamaricihabitans halophyticus]
MSVMETILVFAVAPLAIYGVLSLMTLRRKSAGAGRYRPGQEWDYPAQWWTANPAGISADHPSRVAAGAADEAAPQMETGGARGSW